MASIEYTISGSFPPFVVELRQDSVIGDIIDTQVIQESGTFTFSDVSVPATYVVVVSDSIAGQAVSSALVGTTTTSTTTSTTTTTTLSLFGRFQPSRRGCVSRLT